MKMKEAYGSMTADKEMLYHTRVLVQQTMEKMIEGCRNVKEDRRIHNDAKLLATEIIRDCNTLLMFVKEQE